MKLEPFDRLSEKYSNIKFHENSPIRSRVVPWGRTDGHGEANIRFWCPHRLLFICFVCISEQTAIISLYGVHWLDFV